MSRRAAEVRGLRANATTPPGVLTRGAVGLALGTLALALAGGACRPPADDAQGAAPAPNAGATAEHPGAPGASTADGNSAAHRGAAGAHSGTTGHAPASGAPAPSPAAGGATSARTWPGVARGVAWDANWRDRRGWYGTLEAGRALDRLKTLGATWIAVTPFAYQPDIRAPGIRARRGLSAGLAKDIASAHARGLKVLVKPHIWSHAFDGNDWRGTIAMRTASDWEAWFAQYTRWIVQVARDAAKLSADAFCVGLEYVKSSRTQAERWRQVIRAVRQVYKGPLTYAAHTDEIDLPFWDALDAIGINAYYPLARSRTPKVAAMTAAWRGVGKRLQALSTRVGLPIVFTEVGYASIDGCAQAPYRWPNADDTEDLDEQADCYRALFSALVDAPWFGGMFLWKYKILAEPEDPAERHFAFQGKPAERVVRAGFRQKFARERR